MKSNNKGGESLLENEVETDFSDDEKVEYSEGMHRTDNRTTEDFRVALALSKFGFGAMFTSKQLLRSRGIVQSWKRTGEEHHLAKEDYDEARVMRRLLKIRRVTTFQDLDYHMAVRLFEYDISSSYIAKVLRIPVSTVINWRGGNAPFSIKEGFVDRELVEAKLSAVLSRIKREITEENIAYYMTLRIHSASKKKNTGSGRGIGARTISQMLGKYLRMNDLPERTVASWIKGERTPHNLDPRLVDEELLDLKFKDILLEITKIHINYHLAKELDRMGWTYTAIALFLGVRKEKLRGWIRKGRGNPLAKTFVDQVYVARVLKTMLTTAYGVDAVMNMDKTAQIAGPKE